MLLAGLAVNVNCYVKRFFVICIPIQHAGLVSGCFGLRNMKLNQVPVVDGVRGD